MGNDNKISQVFELAKQIKVDDIKFEAVLYGATALLGALYLYIFIK